MIVGIVYVAIEGDEGVAAVMADGAGLPLQVIPADDVLSDAATVPDLADRLGQALHVPVHKLYPTREQIDAEDAANWNWDDVTAWAGAQVSATQ
ncbi:MAG: hypothetical protein KKA73_18575 [Chloroflexi bacterium]|nr:hypothetical protein [Chloroflexota bacterium]